MIINQRIQQNNLKLNKLELLTREEVMQDIELIADKRPHGESLLAKDSYHTEEGEVIAWLNSLSQFTGKEIRMYWIPDREGVILNYDEFAKHYSDLCYPSSDDVWVVDENRDYLLEWDHEEVFTLFKL